VVSFAKSSTIYHYQSEAKVIQLNPLTSLGENPSSERVKEAIKFLVINMGGKNLNDILLTADCESNFNTRVYVKDDGGSPSSGLFQYKDSTFYYFAQKYHLEDPNIWSVRQQIELTYKLIDDGYGHLWTCYRNYGFKNLK